jgi:nucleosome assembly protein 1-like 1
MFVEKEEFVTAYAELLVKQEEVGGLGSAVDAVSVGNLQSMTSVSAGDDDSEDDGDDDGNENDDDSEEAGNLLDNFPPAVLHRVDALKSLHGDYEDVMKQYLAERAELEAKFQAKTRTLYDKRRDIITGKIDAGEVVSRTTDTKDGEAADPNNNNDATDDDTLSQQDFTVGIPKFWVLTLTQMPVTASMISEHDVECLGYLTDVTCDNYENGEGFQLNFYFSSDNPYFGNEVLTKRYDVPNLLLADEPILKNVEGCEIQWKDGMSLFERKVTKQQRGKGKNAGQIRTVTKTEPAESFFRFFTPPKMPTGEENLQTTTEEEVMKIEAAFDEDYDVAQAFRSHIIPKAVQWFLGNAMEQEMEAAMMATGGGGLGSSSGGGGDPECKQQ